jgi:arylsulfatase A-like enzyme
MLSPSLTAAARPPRNIVLLIVDSLRSASVRASAGRLPFFDRLAAETTCFRRAYASECWTLPSHVSIFTGLSPSQHGAHFQTMAYERPQPTLAEILSAAGYATEMVTRNFVFDGTIAGVTRGFERQSRPLAGSSRANLAALFLTLVKPGVRRHIRRTGFFHPRHGDTRAFVRRFARSLLPADELALARVLDAMSAEQRAGRPYFVCANLYDVHAPYPPARDSLFGPWRSLRGAADNAMFPLRIAKLGQHAYLRDGFCASASTERALRDRYERAVELMDAKLAAFYAAALDRKLLDETLLIITSDHGEAFGEHGLYLHDASVYDTHLHVPLWVRHPALAPQLVDDVVSTKDLFDLILAAAGQRPTTETIMNSEYRAARAIALAEHFYYPHRADIAARYKQNLLAVIIGDEKFVLRREGAIRYDRSRDPDELQAEPVGADAVMTAIDRSGASSVGIGAALEHVRTWQRAQQQSTPAGSGSSSAQADLAGAGCAHAEAAR